MKTLSFSFKSSLGKTTSIRLNKYEADATADQAKQFAQIVADAKAFVKDGVTPPDMNKEGDSSAASSADASAK